jgi:hypothetical protein
LLQARPHRVQGPGRRWISSRMLYESALMNWMYTEKLFCPWATMKRRIASNRYPYPWGHVHDEAPGYLCNLGLLTNQEWN